MNISKINLTCQQISGSTTGIGKLLEVKPAYEYIDGKATKNIAGYRYTVVFESNDFEKVTVKVNGKEPAITNEELQQRMEYASVKFKNLTGKFYRSNSGEYLLSATAEAVEVLEDELVD